MQIRQAQAADVPVLADLYRQSVITHGPAYYSPDQVEAWAAFGADTPAFRQFILEPTTFMVEDETGIVGFAGIAEAGHVTAVYVRSDRLHQGIGSVLMQVVLDHAESHRIPRLYAEASGFSLGLFKKFGFQLYDREIVIRHGVQFERYLVECRRDNATF